MRHLTSMVLAASIAAPAGAAGGAWDGIYSCTGTAPGFAHQGYITVNGQPNGQTFFAIAAITPNTQFYGYGIGQLEGSRFTGTTMFGKPFYITANGHGFTGMAGVVLGTRTVNVSVECIKVW